MKALTKFSSKGSALLAAVAAMVVSNAAFAQAGSAGMTTAFQDAMDETVLWTIGGIVMGIVAIGFLIARSKKAGGG